MLYLFCPNYIYYFSHNYIDNLLINHSFLKLHTFDNDNEIKELINNNNLLYKNIIFIDNIYEDTLKKLSTINLNNNIHILNISKLIKTYDYSYLLSYNINILDSNLHNIELIKEYSNVKYLVEYFNENLIEEQKNKIIDIAIIETKTESNLLLYNKFKYNNIIIDDINENIKCLKEDNIYNIINNYKILLNIGDDNDLNINYDYCIYNKIIIINDHTNNKYSEHLKKYVINCNYDIIPQMCIFILNNYEQIHKNIYKNFDVLNIKNEILLNNNLIIKNIMKSDKFGFIIVRHVNSEKTNKYWIEAYRSIRKYYNNKIVIIDDNSDYNFIKYDSEYINIVNCEFIQSEYNCRGEILGYYYYYKNHFFEKAVIIHDSVFIQKYINFDKYEEIKFIWHFESKWFDQNEETYLLEKINNCNDLLKHYNNKEYIHGCFGVQSVITYKFLNNIQNKYNFFKLLDYVDSRKLRMDVERVFALVCINECEELKTDPSIFGIIHNYINFGYTYDEYYNDKKTYNLHKYAIIKVWTGR
jgi:hypothetical protein